MKVSEVARLRMRASRLTGPSFETPEQAVRHHLAMQAQDYGPAKWSIGQRSKGLFDGDIDAVLEAGSIVRTHVLRPTWHFVARDDIRWLLALTGPRIHRNNASRYRELGLDGRTLSRSEATLARALEGGARLTRKEAATALQGAGIDTSGQRLPHMLMHCELVAVICSGGMQGKQQTYALLDERVPASGRFDRDEAGAELVRRYLAGHGPATVQDLRWWSSLTVADVNAALGVLGSEVHGESVGDLTFWMPADAPDSLSGPRGAHLLQIYDELLVGYSQSRYFGDPRAEDARAAWGDRSRPNNVVLVNGGVAGHWRRTIERKAVRIEVLIYDDLGATAERSVEAAARRLGRFIGLPTQLEIERLRATQQRSEAQRKR